MKLLTLSVSVFLVFQRRHSIVQNTIVQATRSTNFCGNDTNVLFYYNFVSAILNAFDKTFFHGFLLKETDVMFSHGTFATEVSKTKTSKMKT